MAGVINNFWGAEIDGTEDLFYADANVEPTAGSIPSAGAGDYYYAFNTGVFYLDPFSAIPDAGGGYICGFTALSESTIANNQILFDCAAENTEGVGAPGYHFQVQADGSGSAFNVQIVDADGTTVATSTNTPIGESTEHLVEVYYDLHATAGFVYVYVDGELATSATSIDTLHATLTNHYIHFMGAARSPGSIWLSADHIYCMSGATSGDDRLGAIEVISYRSSLNSATPDSGNALSSGTWLAIQGLPFSASINATYTEGGGGGEQYGVVTTDDVGGSAGTGGPNTDTNITGVVQAMKGVWKASRSGGGAAYHGGIISKSNATYRLGRAPLDLTPDPVIYESIGERSVLSLTGFGYTGLKAFSANPNQVAFGDSGTKFYVETTSGIDEHSVSTAYDVTAINSTATNSLNVGSDITSNYADTSGTTFRFAFTDDGTYLYVAAIDSDYIYEYSLSTAWDLSSATMDGTNRVAHSAALPSAMSLGDSDTELYLPDYDAAIYQFTFSTAKDISTLTSTGNGTPSNIKHATLAAHLHPESGGTIFWVADKSTAAYPLLIRQYHLTTPWDITTITDSKVGAYVVPQANVSERLSGIAPDGSSFYMRSGTNLFQFEMGEGIPDDTEYGSIGLVIVAGAQDWEAYSMLYQVLHVPAANDVTLTCDAGSFTLSGIAADLDLTVVLDASTGAFSLTGQTADLTHVQISYALEGYRFRFDDGDEANATWRENQDTLTEEDKGKNVRLRTLVDITGDPPAKQVTLQYRKVGDAEWKTVT